jgi:pimeloyl-ACP methyl ester carboxylesterase
VANRYRAVSPVELLPLHIPVHLIHGANDSIVPVRMAEQYAERARMAGDRVQLTVVPDAGHFDIVAPQSGAWSCVTAALHGIAKQGVL